LILESHVILYVLWLIKYITWWNILLDEIHYWMKYITCTWWNTLLNEIHYWMKYITWWNTLLDEIYYLMKYITLWNTLRYESRYTRNGALLCQIGTHADWIKKIWKRLNTTINWNTKILPLVTYVLQAHWNIPKG
jgi:hypothetical protein